MFGIVDLNLNSTLDDNFAIIGLNKLISCGNVTKIFECVQYIGQKDRLRLVQPVFCRS
jgi:hypothetical protein